MRKNITLFLTFLIFSSIIISQENEFGKYHPFSGRLIITNGGSVNYGLNDYNQLEPAFGYNLSAIYHFGASKSMGLWGLRFTGELGQTINSDNNILPGYIKNKFMYLGGSINYSHYYGNKYLPYFSIGAGITYFDPRDKNDNNISGNYKEEVLTFSGELGMDVLLSERWSLNVNFRAKYAKEDYFDNIARGNHKDVIVSGGLGVSFALFGGSSDSKPAVRKLRDTDKDGVPDRSDLCPNTPEGIIVDKNGCPQDSDNDGVPDYQDICSQTPEGVKVDEDGCPLDSDSDGVPDYMDNCPDTEEGVEVDENGCPVKAEEEIDEEEEEKTPRSYNFNTEEKINAYLYTDGNMFCLQTSAFKSKRNAEREAARLVRKTHKAFVHEANVRGKGKWYQVRVGFYNTKEEAEDYRKKHFRGKRTNRKNDTYLDIK